MVFSFLVASFGLSSVRAAQQSENDKMVLETLRLSLWYQGIEQAAPSPQAQNPSKVSSYGVEELDRSLKLYKISENPSAIDARR